MIRECGCSELLYVGGRKSVEITDGQPETDHRDAYYTSASSSKRLGHLQKFLPLHLQRRATDTHPHHRTHS